MTFKLNYILIPLIVFTILSIGSLIIQPHLAWYRDELLLPEITPPAWVFSFAWHTIATLTAAYILLVWNIVKRDTLWYTILGLLVMNGLLNTGWVWVFFSLREITWALWVALALELNLLVLMGLTALRSFKIALLLLPYTLWVGFAVYLNYEIYKIIVLL